MSTFGYMGKVLHLDLTSGEYETEELDLDASRGYLGSSCHVFRRYGICRLLDIRKRVGQ